MSLHSTQKNQPPSRCAESQPPSWRPQSQPLSLFVGRHARRGAAVTRVEFEDRQYLFVFVIPRSISLRASPVWLFCRDRQWQALHHSMVSSATEQQALLRLGAKHTVPEWGSRKVESPLGRRRVQDESGLHLALDLMSTAVASQHCL